MRIGYLVPEFPTQTHAFFWREVSALRDLGHEVHLFSTRRPGADACLHEFAEEARRQTTYLVPTAAPRALSRLLSGRTRGLAAAARYVRSCEPRSGRDMLKLWAVAVCAMDLVSHAERRGLDHLHVHSCADAAHLAAIARLLGGPPFSLTLHGDLPVYGTDHHLKMAQAKFVAAVTRPLQAQVRAISGLPLARVPVIWMGVDTDVFEPRRRGGGSDAIQLLTVARLNRTKGHTYALRALRNVRAAGTDLRYVIAGAGPEQEAIEDEIRALGLDDAVQLTGTVSEKIVLDLLRASDVFLLPSFGLGEAAPVSVMEAMSCGLPAICSRIGGTPDMVNDRQTGLLVDPEDVAGLTTAISALASDPELRAELGRAARAKALDAFDYRANAQALVNEMLRDESQA